MTQGYKSRDGPNLYVVCLAEMVAECCGAERGYSCSPCVSLLSQQALRRLWMRCWFHFFDNHKEQKHPGARAATEKQGEG